MPGTVIQIRNRSQKMPDIVSILPIPALLVDLPSGEIIHANPAACSLLGFTGSGCANSNLKNVCSDEDKILLERLFDRALRGRLDGQRRLTLDLSRLGGRAQRIELILESYPLPNRPAALLLLRDVTYDTLTAEKAHLFSLTLALLQKAVAISDVQQPGCPLIYANPELERLFHYNAGEMIGKQLESLITNPTDAATMLACQGSSWAVVRARHPDGSPFWDRVRTVALPDARGRTTHILHIHEDLSIEENPSNSLQVSPAPQPGILERHGFLNRLAGMLELAHMNTTSVAVMVIEISNLQHVFGLYSFSMADDLLKMLALRLGTLIRQSDLLAGGSSSQFLLACYNVGDESNVETLATRLNESLAEPVLVGKEPFHVHSLVGIARFPEDGVSAEILLRKASLAVQEGRNSRKDPVTMASPMIAARLAERHKIERELRTGLEEKQFLLHYQPQLQLNNGQLLGIEALLRWNHPVRGLLAPDSFVPVAEESELILPIGEWVMQHALQMYMDYAHAGVGLGRLALNVSQANLRRSRFIDVVNNMLNSSGIAHGVVELEMTESLLIEDQDLFTRQIQSLKRLGLRIAIDDFGTRYTALDLLRHLPIDTLKIDRAFVHNIHRNKNDAAICRSIIALAASLNLHVVAEGVEEQGELAFLESCGCHAAQGFLLARPMPAEALPDYISSLSSSHPSDP